MKRIILSLAILPAITSSAMADSLALRSPDGRNEVSFSKPGKELTYSVKVDGKDVILPSRAGLDIDNRVWKWLLANATSCSPTAGWTFSKWTV